MVYPRRQHSNTTTATTATTAIFRSKLSSSELSLFVYRLYINDAKPKKTQKKFLTEDVVKSVVTVESEEALEGAI